MPGRIVAMASADAPLKGVATLLEAFAKLRTERDVELLLVSRPKPGGRTEQLLDEPVDRDSVRFVNGLSDTELAELVGSAEVACVPSLYEGFSLPAVEAMACGTPLVASRAGAIPEVVGEDGVCADLVTPGDAGARRRARRPARRPRPPGPAGRRGPAPRPGAVQLARGGRGHGRGVRPGDRGHPPHPAHEGTAHADRRLRPARRARRATACSTWAAAPAGTPSSSTGAAPTWSPSTRTPTRSAVSRHVRRDARRRARPPPAPTPTSMQGDALAAAVRRRRVRPRRRRRGPGAHPRRQGRDRRDGPGAAAGRHDRRHRAPLAAREDLLGAVRRVPRGRGRPRPHLHRRRARRQAPAGRADAARHPPRARAALAVLVAQVRGRRGRRRPRAAAGLPPAAGLGHHEAPAGSPGSPSGCSTR